MTSLDVPWLLAEPAASLQLLAERDGIWLRGPNLAWDHPAGRSGWTPVIRLGRLLPTVIPQLCELGLATMADDGVRMTYADFTTFETHGIDAFADVVPWAPFTLELAAHRWLGAADFRYNYRFYLGLRSVSLTHRGCFVRQGTTMYRLDAQTFAMIEAIDAFNALPAEAKTSPEAFLRFATVKGLAEGVGAQLDRYLAEERVLVPSRVGLDLIVEDEGRISFAPKLDGVESDTMRQAFFALDNVETVYALDDSGGGRLRVVLDEQQREVLRRMQRVRHLSGAERAAVLRAPQAVFDGVAEAVDVDPAAFGPRVQGVGDFPFVTQPYLRQSSGFLDVPEGLTVPYAGGTFSAGLTCRYADGSSVDVPFTSRQALHTLHQQAREAWHRGVGTVDFRGKSVLVDAPFIQALDELGTESLPLPAPHQERSTPKGRYLLIYRNEDNLEYTEDTGEKAPESDLALPQALKPDVVLKEHQRVGVVWLQRNVHLGRRGCLLADDMGLGKTLQVLTFLAWLIEQGALSSDSTNADAGPWDPILEERDGTRVLLTPHTGDGGIDVVAVQPQAIRLIQCKHTSGYTLVDADVIAEVVAALDGYRARWLSTLSLQRPLRLVIVTNGEATRQAQSAAAGPGVEIITAKQLWRILAAAHCTYYDVLALEDRRLASMRELPEALRRALAT